MRAAVLVRLAAAPARLAAARIRFGWGPTWGSLLLASLLLARGASAAEDDAEEVPRARDGQQVAARERAIEQMQIKIQITKISRQRTGVATEELQKKLRYLDRMCRLSESQKAKLTLAAQGDNQRCSEAFAMLMKTYAALQQGQIEQRDELAEELEALQRESEDPFGEQTLFGKTLKHLLGSEQLDRLVREPPRQEYEALVAQNIRNLGRRIGLRQEQYPSLADLLAWETDPPKKYGRYEYMYLVYQLSQVREDRLKSVLDETQRERLAQQYIVNAGEFLEKVGVLDQAPAAREAADAVLSDDPPSVPAPEKTNEARR